MASLLNSRGLLPFPLGDSSSDTIVQNTHWNLTTLQYWNYTFNSNNTVSNDTKCVLMFDPYTPKGLMANGTWVNDKSCYSETNSTGPRSKAGVFFAVYFFVVCIGFTIYNLEKRSNAYDVAIKKSERHAHFPLHRSQRPWYWMIPLGLLASVSGAMMSEVDEYFLPSWPVVMVIVLWFLMLPATMCAIFESARAWGYWMERLWREDSDWMQIIDDNRGRKGKIWLPVVFYSMIGLNLIMALSQSWGAIQLQRDVVQAFFMAAPAATNVRFKLASVFLFISWLTIIISLLHSMKTWTPVPSPHKRLPLKFVAVLFLALVTIGYVATSSVLWSVSPINLHANLGFVYGLGWAPMAIIVAILQLCGKFELTEDAESTRLLLQETS